MSARAELGKRGEAYAARRLEAQGWHVLARNWRCKHGEIDLILVRDGLLAMVEVRTRRGRRLGTPEESIGYKKRARLTALAAAYLAAHPWSGPWRIDVVAIEVPPGGGPVRFAHYPSAVGG